MKQVNATFDDTYSYVACDELLLRKAEAGEVGELVWFWQSSDYFVALGRICRVAEEVFIENCRRDDVGIIRRLSGGGTVLQGPGCVNYSLVLDYGRHGDLRNVDTSFEYVLGALSDAFADEGLELDKRGLSDLVWRGRKVSGNAQVRKRRYMLHHGSFLVDMDADIISEYLAHPPREPHYRRKRTHGEFVGNLHAEAETVKRAVLRAFPADECGLDLDHRDLDVLEDLVRHRYRQDSWNFRF